MTERLSNAATPFIQYVVFPLVVLASVGSSIVLATTVSPAEAAMLVVILPLLYLVGSKLWRCKQVTAIDDGLRVGDQVVPYAEISEVTTFSYSSPELVTIRLASGARILFLAKLRASIGFSEHPVAGWLRDQAKRR